MLIAAGNANPAQYQPPQRATTSDRSHSLPSPRATALYLHFAPLSRAPHTNTHSVSERTATYLRKLRSNQRIIPRCVFRKKSGDTKNSCEPGHRGTRPSLQLLREVLVDHTTQLQPCTTTHGRDSNFEPCLQLHSQQPLHMY